MEAIGPESEFSRKTFEGLDGRSQAVLHRSFDECAFIGCKFLEVDFTGSRFVDCAFLKCDLSLMRIKDCSFINAKFEESKLVGVNWTEALWPEKDSLNSIDFFNCILSQSTFSGLKLKKMKLMGCTASDADFAEADMAQSDCRKTDFSGSRFMHTDLSGADFRDAKNYVIHPGLNKLSKARFSFPEVMSLLFHLDIIIS